MLDEISVLVNQMDEKEPEIHDGTHRTSRWENRKKRWDWLKEKSPVCGEYRTSGDSLFNLNKNLLIMKKTVRKYNPFYCESKTFPTFTFLLIKNYELC